MTAASDPALLALVGLRLASFAPLPTVAARAGLSVAEATPLLEGLEARGLARRRPRPSVNDGEPVEAWSLTPDGRIEGERRCAAELDDLGLRPAVHDAYLRFLALNQPVLAVCTSWQVREVDGVPVPNDHADPAYDADVVAALEVLDVDAQPVVEELGDLLARFAGYGGRLAQALDLLRAGEGDWFTKPTIDSYHSIWFELHEHLLATLGIERSTEPVSPRETNAPSRLQESTP